MGHTHEAGFLTRTYSSGNPDLPSVQEGLEALTRLSAYAHIKLDRSSLRSQRLIDPVHLERYMVHIESRVLPLVVRHGFLGEPFFSKEVYHPYENYICDWPKAMPELKKMYAVFPSVVASLEMVERIMRNEADWKEKVRQECSPAGIENFLVQSRETYLGKPPVFEPYAGP